MSEAARSAPATDAVEGAEATIEAPSRAVLRRISLLVYAALAVLGVATAMAVLRAPTDPLTLLQLVATVALAAGLGARYVLARRLAERELARDEGQTRILQGMSRSVSSDALVETIVDELRRTADADHIVVARLRPVERVVETTLVSTRAPVPAARSILPAAVLDPTQARRPRRRRERPEVLGGGRAEQQVAESLAARLAEAYALNHTLAAPLVAGELMVGALILSRRQEREWTLSDRRLLAFSAGELSAALARAFQLEDAEIRANIDALTGLPNRRYLEEIIATVGPHRRSRDRLGALMIDLDHFKRLNDRYGHLAGDRVLRAVGERISASVRADDTPARYGGEEFAVVLRRADPQQAVEVAERIRDEIAHMTPEELGMTERLTVSIGVAVAESPVTDAGTLLGAADEALYRAKHQGRNRVVLSDRKE